MYKNKNQDGTCNLCGARVAALRKAMEGNVSQQKLAGKLQLLSVDVDKNAIQRIESGQRFVTDIELRALAQTFGVCTDYLLGLRD